MFESFLFVVFIISCAIYLISTRVRQYPQNQGDPNIRLRRIESICAIINITSFAILLSSFFLSTLKVPEIIILGIDIFTICTFIFSLCCILLMQKLIQKLPIDETDNTFRSRLRLWSLDTLKMFSKKVHSIISAGKKRVASQQQSAEEHSVTTDSNTKIKNNDETSNIFIAIIFIVTLFLFYNNSLCYIRNRQRNSTHDIRQFLWASLQCLCLELDSEHCCDHCHSLYGKQVARMAVPSA